MRINNNDNSFFGFSGRKDFGNTLFSFNFLPLVILNSFLGGISTFVTNFVFDSYQSVYTLLFLLIVDAMSGIYAAVKSDTFSVGKLPRVLIVMLAYNLLLAVSFHLGKTSDLWSWLPNTVYFGLTTVVFISILDNCGKSGLLPTSFINNIKNLIKKDDTNIPDNTTPTNKEDKDV